MNFAYYLFLLLIIFLTLLIFEKNLKVSPKKIKIYLSIVILLFCIRNIGLFLLCVLENSTIIYYLKPIIFLNHLIIPLITLAITYVYLRSEKLKFIWCYVIAGILAVIYGIIMNISKVTVQVSYLYGFIIRIDREVLLCLFSLIVLGSLLILNVMLIDKPFVNKRGLYFIIAAICTVMIEDVIIIGGVKIFPYSVIGQAIFLLIINLVLKSFKKIREL